MVPLRYPLYMAMGATISMYGTAYALTGGGFEAAAVATLPGMWLAGHGLLNGVAFATDDREPRSRPRSGRDGGDGAGDADAAGTADGSGDSAGDAASRSGADSVVRAPY